MTAYTSVRRRTGTVDISKAVSHRESAFLAPGRHDRSTIQLEVLFLFGDACEPHSRPMGDQRPPQKSSPGSCTTAFSVVDHSPNTSSAFRSAPFVDVDERLPENQSRSAQEALELAPTAAAWRVQGRPEPLADTWSRSRVRCIPLTHTAQTISFFHRLATNNA